MLFVWRTVVQRRGSGGGPWPWRLLSLGWEWWGSLSRDASASTPLDRSGVRPTRARTTPVCFYSGRQASPGPSASHQSWAIISRPRTKRVWKILLHSLTRYVCWHDRTDRYFIQGPQNFGEAPTSNRCHSLFCLPRCLPQAAPDETTTATLTRCTNYSAQRSPLRLRP